MMTLEQLGVHLTPHTSYQQMDGTAQGQRVLLPAPAEAVQDALKRAKLPGGDGLEFYRLSVYDGDAVFTQGLLRAANRARLVYAAHGGNIDNAFNRGEPSFIRRPADGAVLGFIFAFSASAGRCRFVVTDLDGNRTASVLDRAQLQRKAS